MSDSEIRQANPEIYAASTITDETYTVIESIVPNEVLSTVTDGSEVYEEYSNSNHPKTSDNTYDLYNSQNAPNPKSKSNDNQPQSSNNVYDLYINPYISYVTSKANDSRQWKILTAVLVAFLMLSIGLAVGLTRKPCDESSTFIESTRENSPVLSQGETNQVMVRFATDPKNYKEYGTSHLKGLHTADYQLSGKGQAKLYFTVAGPINRHQFNRHFVEFQKLSLFILKSSALINRHFPKNFKNRTVCYNWTSDCN